MDIEKYIASGVLESYALDQLSDKERASVESNLEIYPRLRTELQIIEEGIETLATRSALTPSKDLKKRVFSDLNNHEEPVETKTGSLISKTKNPWSYIAAASVVLLLITSFLAYTYYSKWQKAKEVFAQLQAANQLMVDNYDRVNNDLDKLNDQIDVINDPDVKNIRLNSTNEGVIQEANVYWNTRTKEVFINGGSLKKLSEAQQYQLWAIVDDKPVALGVFDVPEKYILKMNNTVKPSLFAVTIEPRGGSVNPTLSAMQVTGQVG